MTGTHKYFLRRPETVNTLHALLARVLTRIIHEALPPTRFFVRFYGRTYGFFGITPQARRAPPPPSGAGVSE
jgi:hypothetical protein